MSVEIVMPRAGLTMVEGTISEWKVSEGDVISKGQTIMEFENEKNIIPYEALASGIIHLLAKVDDTVEVGKPIALLATDKAEYESLALGLATPAPREAALPEEDKLIPPEPPRLQSLRVRATGYAKKLAAAAGVELKDVVPSGGPDGLRIVAKDVQAYIERQKAAPPPASEKPAVIPAVCTAEDVITETPWTGVRKTIARNMLSSLQQMAQTTSVCEVDATALLELRKKLVEAQDVLGVKISVNDLLCKLFAKVVAKHPLMNATFDGSTLYSHSRVQLSMAVATDYGLMVPVIRNADKLSITELSLAAKDIAQRARDKQLKIEDQQGGTFTISNVGMFPIDFATPVIPLPQTAIIGIGRCVKKPAVMPDGSFAARDMMHLFLSFDHRVIDGLEAGRFFADVEKYFANPELILA